MFQYITINGEQLTKTAAQEKARKIKNNGPAFSYLSLHEVTFMADYLAYWREDYLKDKTIKSIIRVPEIKYGKGITLKVVFTDGKFEFPSIRAGRTKSAEANAAMRDEIEQQVVKWRKQHYYHGHACALHDGPAEPPHIDHYPIKFKTIRNNFLKAHGLELSEVETKEGFEGIGVLMANEQLAERWRAFHFVNASYRVLCASCNLKLQ